MLRSSLARLLLCAFALGACRSEGRVTLRFSLEGLPADLSGLFLHTQIRDADGDLLSGSIVPATATARLALSVPHGADRVAVVELRDSASAATSNVVAYGVSAPFSLTVGEDTVVEAVVRLRRVPAIVSLVAPDTTRDRSVEVAVTADREGVAQVVLAQDPSLTFGRQVFDVAGASTHNVRYDLDAACRASNTCTDGRRNVFARLVDESGYSSTATSTPVFVDTQAPAVLPGSGTVQFIAPAELLTPNAAGSGVTVRLSFVFDEPVTSTPAVALADSGLAFDLVSTQLGAYIYERVVLPTDPAGRQRPTVQARDVAGNEAPLLAPDLEYVVDHEPPTRPQVDVPGAIVYHRDPYRETSQGGASFTVVGAPGAVEGGARVVVYDRAEAFVDGAEAATRAGAATAAPDGSFTVQLAPVDLQAVYLLVLDEAGNFHDATGRAVRVRDISWRVPAGVTAGAEPPVDVFTIDRLGETARLDLAGVIEVEDTSALADGRGLEVHYDPRWTERLPVESSVPDAHRFSGVATDPARGRLVLYGGRSANDVVRGDTWEWSGRTWELKDPGLLRPECDDGSLDGDDPFNGMTYHGALGLTLLVCRYLQPRQAPPLPAGGTDVLRAFGWDGSAWRSVAIDAAPAPGGRTGAVLAYDAARGRTVLFGGNRSALVFPGAADTTLGDTWELEAVPTSSVGAPPRLRWIEPTLTGPTPPGRDRHAMVYAPSLGGVVMFGGVSADPDRHTLDDLWIFDGATWTEVPRSGAWPPARALHALTVDPRTGAVGVIGGVADEPTSTSVDSLGEGLSDAWWFDGSTWTQTATSADTPRGPGLVDASLGAEGDVYVLSGVAPGAIAAPSRTFIVGPARWSDRTPSGAIPPQLEQNDLMYHPVEEQFWLQTAREASRFTYANETWVWTDSGWRFRAREPTLGLPFSAMFDTRRGEVMLLVEDHTLPVDHFLRPYLRWYVNDGSGWVGTATVTPDLPQLYQNLTTWSVGFYDRSLDRPVVFAFERSTPKLLFADVQELFTWTNPSWQRIDSRPLLAASVGYMAALYDEASGRSLLQFWDSKTFQWHTYSFDGTDWTSHTGTEGSWTFGRGVIADVARQRVLTVGTQAAGRSIVWSWNGARYRVLPTSGTPPPRAVYRSIAYDPRRNRIVIMEAPTEFEAFEAPLGAVYTLDVDGAAAPTVALRARLGQGGVAPATIERIRVEANAGGVGYPVASAAPSAGVTLSAYDRRASAWIDLASNTADATEPEPLTLDLTADAIEPLVFADDAELLLAVRSTDGLGSGDEPPRVTVDRIDIVVSYRIP